MKTEEFLQSESDRGTAYKILSTCYYLPEDRTLASLPELEEALKRQCPEAAKSVAEMRQETNIESLRIDYSRLFVGPFKLLAPPYGSVYLEDKREVMGASTLDAIRIYKEAGLVISDNIKESPDHIAIELEFMYYLIFKEVEAVENAGLKATTEHMARQKTFLERHLGVWVADFAGCIRQGAKTGFYRHLALATERFVHDDFEYVSSTLRTSLRGIS